MRKIKTQKGITLIALIITIVVLLILAVVAISSIQNDGIIGKATDTSKHYNDAVANEQQVIGTYFNFLNSNGQSSGSGTSGGNGGSTGNREGQTVKYDSNGDGTDEDWIVLTDRDGLLEIVSANAMGSLTLGSGDAEIKANLLKYLDLNGDDIPDDLDGDGVIEEGDTDYNKDGNKTSDPQDIAIASYNNAITTINNYCKSLVKPEIKDKVRSVGASTDASGNYSSTNFNSWFKKSSTVKVKAGDENYKTDYDKMVGLGIAKTNKSYWMALREVNDYSSIVELCVRYVYTNGGLNDDDWWDVLTNGELYGNYLWLVYSDGDVRDDNPSCAVRLVITNPEI